ncbi:MAG: type IIL restriction-modification enzyme MmeI, partial [Thiobacillus sp.]
LPVFVPQGHVLTHSLFVFAYEDDGHFGLLSSVFHWWWAVTRSSTLEARTRYAPTDCFANFPQPLDLSSVAPLGKALHEHRSEMMRERQLGVTATYNMVIDGGNVDEDVLELRRLHRELDLAVAHAYGWDDLRLDHGYFDTKWGPRYTVGPIVRQEILDRLLELNHERHAEEVAQRLHEKGAKKPKKHVVASDSQALF